MSAPTSGAIVGSERPRLHLERCIVCAGSLIRPQWSVARTPIHPFRPPAAEGSQSGFGCLEIVRCGSCGHIYNAAFDPGRADDLYAALVLTNMPVSPSMLQAIESTAQYILGHAKKRPLALEIGGGGGALSLRLSRDAEEMHMVEPSRALSADRFHGTGVTFHRSMFPTPVLVGRRFDVIVCRQVLEHIPDPQPFLAAMRAHVSGDGVAYVEVPSAEYIEQAGSLVDFHYPHVHFYHRPHLEALLARTGFAVIDIVDVKDGHDTGFLLRPVPPHDRPLPTLAGPEDFAVTLTERRERGFARLRQLGSSVALYGANAYSQSLLGLYPQFSGFGAMLDDTPMYEGQHAYGPSIDLPIAPPSAGALRAASAVLITAYLHDVGIARKVRALGYGGPILTVRCDRQAGRGQVPPSLFAA